MAAQCGRSADLAWHVTQYAHPHVTTMVPGLITTTASNTDVQNVPWS